MNVGGGGVPSFGLELEGDASLILEKRLYLVRQGLSPDTQRRFLELARRYLPAEIPVPDEL
jgi:hypothetical protein